VNPFERPEPWFPADVMDLDGQMLGLGVQVQARVGRRGVQGEVVGWRPPDHVRILTEELHLHTVAAVNVQAAGTARGTDSAKDAPGQS
jgi:hypothetical protein